MVYNTSANHTEKLVLYSSKSNVWKIADFGITTEGTSGRALTTVASRGTASYRAPELLDASKSTYTRQVDIWALGCIIFELAFNKKAFSDDISVLSYALSKQPPEIPSTLDLVLGKSLEIDKAS